MGAAVGIFLLMIAAVNPPDPGEKKVVLVVIDGVRHDEVDGRARDDAGRPVKTEHLLPNLTRWEREGVYCPAMKINNPFGISLPAYADILAGRRQIHILSNGATDPSPYPTLFQAVKQGLHLGPDGVACITSWDAIGRVAVTRGGPADNDFYRNADWTRSAAGVPGPGQGLRSDADTFGEFCREVPRRHPRFVFVQFVEPDEQAHRHEAAMRQGIAYGINHYHRALTADDSYIGRIWSLLQADPYYRGSTYLIVTTDHGRCNPKWWTHGHAPWNLCSGCRSVFAIAVGPGLKPCRTPGEYHHTDLAPTIAHLLGVTMPTATGREIAEFLPPSTAVAGVVQRDSARR